MNKLQKATKALLDNNSIIKITQWKEEAWKEALTTKDPQKFKEALGMRIAFGMVLNLLEAMSCPTCHTKYTDQDNKDAINSLGMCLLCNGNQEHVYGDDDNVERDYLAERGI